MANITSVKGYITILAKKKEDVIKFIYLVNKHLSDGEYYTYIQNFAKMDIKEISDNFYKEIGRDYKLSIDLGQYKDFIPYTVLFYGAGRWAYYNNVEDLKSLMEESISRTNDKGSLKMLKDIIKAGIKLIFDYIEEDAGTLCIEECVDIIDFGKNEKCSEISIKHHDWTIENLKNLCGYDECFTLKKDDLLNLIKDYINNHRFNKETLNNCENFDNLINNWDHHYSQMFSKFINKFDTDEVFFDFDIDAIEPDEECNINFREELENYISSLL